MIGGDVNVVESAIVMNWMMTTEKTIWSTPKSMWKLLTGVIIFHIYSLFLPSFKSRHTLLFYHFYRTFPSQNQMLIFSSKCHLLHCLFPSTNLDTHQYKTYTWLFISHFQLWNATTNLFFSREHFCASFRFCQYTQQIAASSGRLKPKNPRCTTNLC